MSRGRAWAAAATLVLLAGACGGGDSDEGASPPTNPLDSATPSDPTTTVPTGPGWTLVSTTGDEPSFGAAPMGGDEIVVTGYTTGDLAAPSAGDRDIWVGRFDATVDPVWDLQWGTAGRDSPLGVDVDPDDAIFLGGYTDADLVDTNRGKVDGWVSRIESEGTPGWSTQFGGPDWDRVFDVSAGPDSTFATGYTLGEMTPDAPGGNDGFVVALDPSTGEQQWVTMVGTPESDWGQGSAVTPDGDVVVTGYTMGDLGAPNQGGRDAFLAELSSTGRVDWTTQIGSAGDDWTQGVGIDPVTGAIAIAGYTDGELPGPALGDHDALVAVFEPDGTMRWVQQFGTEGTDSAFEPRFVGGQVVVSGTASGVLGDAHFGGRDAIVAWLDADSGVLDRVEQFGTATDDEAYGLAVTSDGAVWATGYTGGAISEGVETTDTDLWIRRFPN